MKNKIVVTLSTFSEYGEGPLRLLEESNIGFSINSSGYRLKEEEIVPLCADATGLIVGVEPYTRETLEQLPNLKCISRAGVGTGRAGSDQWELRGAHRRGLSAPGQD